MNDTAFELKEVSYSHLGKYPALCGLSMKIFKGQRVAVIGANGTGKSTLLHLLDGLIYPHEGTVTAFGEELGEVYFESEPLSRSFRKRVGLVFQNVDTQLFCPTVRDDIVFSPLQLGVSPEVVLKRLEHWAAVLNISHLLERVPYQLSVGEKRKVALASVLINEPEVLLLDEPTAGLDPQSVREIIDVMLQLHEAGATLVTATHDLHLVGEIADTVHVFGRDRRIVRVGSPEEILADSEFLRANNLVHIHKHFHHGKVHSHPHEHACAKAV